MGPCLLRREPVGVQDRVGEVVGPDAEEVDLGRDRACGVHPGRGFDHRPDLRPNGAREPHRQRREIASRGRRSGRPSRPSGAGREAPRLPRRRRSRAAGPRRRRGGRAATRSLAARIRPGRAASCHRRSRGRERWRVAPFELRQDRGQDAAVIFLARPFGRGEEGELGAKQADALGAGLQGGAQLGDSRRRSPARVTEWPSSVTEGSSRLAIASRTPLGPLAERERRRLDPLGGRRQEHDPVAAVDHHRAPGSGREQLVADPDDHRDPQRPRHDRRVGRDAPGREGDPGDAAVELRDLGRPQIRCDQDLPAAVAGTVVLRLGVADRPIRRLGGRRCGCRRLARQAGRRRSPRPAPPGPPQRRGSQPPPAPRARTRRPGSPSAAMDPGRSALPFRRSPPPRPARSASASRRSPRSRRPRDRAPGALPRPHPGAGVRRSARDRRRS